MIEINHPPSNDTIDVLVPDQGESVEPIHASKSLCDLTATIADLNSAVKLNQLGRIRKVFETLVASYPTASLIWYSWTQFELISGNFDFLEVLFSRCLKTNFSIPIWRLYLSYVKNYQLPLIADPLESRQVMLKAYDFAVQHIGLDVESGLIWSDYLAFATAHFTQLQASPNSTFPYSSAALQTCSYEQQQLMDLIRKIYHRSLTIPMDGLETLWHNYDAYENSLNKLTAKKLVSEKSSVYMTSRAVLKELKEIVSGIDKEAYPVKPESLNDSEYQDRITQWFRWIEWEKSNPMKLQDQSLLNSRIIYAFKKSLMSLRHFPQAWLSHANFLRFDVSNPSDAEVVLKNAFKICPNSPSIVASLTDLLESATPSREPGEVRKYLDSFIANLESQLDQLKAEIITAASHNSDQEISDESFNLFLKNSHSNSKIKDLAGKYRRLIDEFNWSQVQLMNLVRRLLGLNAARNIFSTARKSPHATPFLFQASANLEFRIHKNSTIAAKIHELALNRFPHSLSHSLVYLQFLITQNDEGNIRALFERIVSSRDSVKLATKSSDHEGNLNEYEEDERIYEEIWRTFYDFERQVGDWKSISRVEERMRAALTPQSFLSKESFLTIRNDLESLSEPLILPPIPSIISIPKGLDYKLIPFHVPEAIFQLILQLQTIPHPYEEPKIDVNRFISFIDRVNINSSPSALSTASSPQMKALSSKSHRSLGQTPISVGIPSKHRHRRLRNFDDDPSDTSSNKPTNPSKQLKTHSSIFEDRRRY